MVTYKENQGMINTKIPEGRKECYDQRSRHAEPQGSEPGVQPWMFMLLLLNCTKHTLYTILCVWYNSQFKKEFLSSNWSCQTMAPTVSGAPPNGSGKCSHSPPSGTKQGGGQNRTSKFPFFPRSLRSFLKSHSRTHRKEEARVTEHLNQHLYKWRQN